MTASTVVMIRPLTFCSNPDTIGSNSFQKDAGALSPEMVMARARSEFDQFQKILTDNGIGVMAFEEVPGAGTPDACFPNNWFCQLPDGKIFIFPMQPVNRRKEIREDVISSITNTGVTDLTPFASQNLFLEGTGSLILDHDHRIGYACLSPRTSPEVLKSFSELSGYRIIAFTSHDEKGNEVYHTNVMMALGKSTVVINLTSVIREEEKRKLLESFQATGKEVIDISHHQMNNFAGNMLYLSNAGGKTFWAMSERAFSVLTPAQRSSLEKDGALIHAPLTTIEDLGGGSARCLMAELFLPQEKLKKS